MIAAFGAERWMTSFGGAVAIVMEVIVNWRYGVNPGSWLEGVIAAFGALVIYANILDAREEWQAR